jgi:hypothetical protein
MERLFLSQECFFCHVEGKLVFLNTATDRYIGLDKNQTTATEKLLNIEEATSCKKDMGNNSRQLISAELLQRTAANLSIEGIAHHKASHGKEPKPTEPLEPKQDLIGQAMDSRPTLKASQIAVFFYIATVTAIRFKTVPLKNIIRRIQSQQAAAESEHQQRLAEFVEIANFLRPLAFTAKDQCLYESMVLLEFLRWYGIHANLVIGIKMGPFRLTVGCKKTA